LHPSNSTDPTAKAYAKNAAKCLFFSLVALQKKLTAGKEIPFTLIYKFSEFFLF